MTSKLLLLCLTFFAASIATQSCGSNQYLSNGECLPQNVANCRIYTAYTNNCIVCTAGNYATNGLCAAQNLPNCMDFQPNQNLCLTCGTGYYVNGLNVCVPQNAANCATYVPNRNRCASCTAPLTLVNGACTATQATQCQTFASNGVSCLVCVGGYFVQNGGCLLQSVVNCAGYMSNQNVCMTCLAGFYLNNGMCDRAFVSKCIQYEPNRNYCLICLDGFYAFNGACLTQNVTNCGAYVSNTNQCSSCMMGYQLQNNMCMGMNVPNCATLLANGTCTACMMGYYLMNNACMLQSIPNCMTYQAYMNICTACMLNFNLLNNTCVAQVVIPYCSVQTGSTCTTCNLNYYLSNNACVLQSISNCMTYQANVNICTACMANFILQNNACVAPAVIPNCSVQTGSNCNTCNSNYYLSNNTCILQNIPNCMTYQANVNICSACMVNFNLLNNACVPFGVIQFCATQVGNVCSFCSVGYYLNNNACLAQSVPNCSVYVLNVNQCSTCTAASNTDVINGRCVAKPANCMTYIIVSGAFKCTFCNVGYFLDAGVSDLCYEQGIFNCISYQPNLLICTACQANYTLQNNACVAIGVIQFCQIQVGAVCNNCTFGYYLSNNVCLVQSLPNCSLYEANVLRCRICGFFSGYDVLDGLCVLKPVNCTDYSIVRSGFVCSVCSTGFYLGPNNICLAQNIANCMTYQSNVNVCTACMLNFNLINNACVPPAVVPNCATQLGATCSLCTVGFYLNNNVCVLQNIPNCMTYQANANICTACMVNFTLQNNQCVAPAVITNCQVQSGSTCITCFGGFYVDNNSCLAQSVPNCVAYTANLNLCSQCSSSFILVAGLCVAMPANCMTYETIPGGVRCTVCMMGFYLNANNVCVAQNIANCMTYQANANICTVCMANFILQNNACVVPAPIPNCSDQVGSTCNRCAFGFYLSNNSCLTQSLPNCLLYVANVNQCSQCLFNSGYEVLNGLCVLTPVNCQTYSPVNGVLTCTICNRNYYLNSNTCVLQSIPNCMTYQANANICTACMGNFILQNNACVAPAAIPNCAVQTGSTCSTCNLNYYLSNNSCVLQNIANCMTYQPNVNICTACMANFILQSNACVAPAVIPNCSVQTGSTCTTCAFGFYLFNNACFAQNIANCMTYQSNANVCTVCMANFVLQNNACVAPAVIPNCATQVGSTCNTCSFGFYLSANTCITQNIANCATYTPNQNVCIQCLVNFNLQNNVCVAPTVIPNCSNQVGSNCFACQGGFFLMNNMCMAQTVSFCINYQDNSNTCSACQFGFILNSAANTCDPDQNTNCLTVVNATFCSLCYFGFYSRNGVCTPQNVVGCIQYNDNSNFCNLCAFSFFLRSNGTCGQQNDPNCLIYQFNSGLCDTCNNGFYNNNGVCAIQNIANCLYAEPNLNSCNTCNTGFYPSGSQCLAQSLPNCLLYNSNANTCILCNEGFDVANDLCVVVDTSVANCATYNTVNRCTACVANFYLSNNQCFMQMLPNCIAYTVGQNVCTRCAANFVLSNGLCFDAGSVVTIPKCLRQTGNTCTFCRLGYFGNTGNTQCVQANEPGVSLRFVRNGVSNFISILFDANFNLVLSNSPTRTTIFEQSVVYSPVPPTGAAFTLSFSGTGFLSEMTPGIVTLEPSSPTMNGRNQFIFIPDTAPYTYTIQNTFTQRFLQGCCTTGTTPVIFTVISVDSLPPF